MSGTPTAADLAAFLRDVTEATTKQQSTVESQTTNGFVHWLADLPARPGISVPYMARPDSAPTFVVEVRPPADPEPTPPRRLPDDELGLPSTMERAKYDEEWRRHREESARWHVHKNLYDDLFSARTPAEDMELVFAYGFLGTNRDGFVGRRHLVTAAVEVELDRSTQALRVAVVDAARLELNWTDPVTRSTLGDAAEPLRDLQDALCLAEVATAMHALRASFGTRSVELASPATVPEHGRVGLASMPALLLRKRDSSFLLQLLRDMADDLSDGGFVSEPFRMIVSPNYEPGHKDVLSERAALPLPANAEQRVMIDNARREPHLVIQGPPGTGKTHTIANLAAVLMAEGRRVLVTAETERALGEVQAKLPADMQALMLPMLRERGTGPLQASVNALSARASALSTADARARRQAEELERLEATEAAITTAQENLRGIARRDREPRTFGDLTLPVAGHLIALADRADQLELADRLLSPDGTLLPEHARALLELRTVVTSVHQELATHRFPAGLMSPSDFATWLDEHRSQLAVLGDPGSYDHAELADSVDALIGLATSLQRFPSVAWSSITRTSEQYKEAGETAARVAADLDHSVIIDPAHDSAGTIALCEEYLALDGRRFDEPLTRLLERHDQARRHAARSPILGDFEQYDRAGELTKECEEALELLRRDRSGLLDQHVQDHRTQGHSGVDTLREEAARLVDGSRDAVGLAVTIGEGAPAPHELATQAEGLHAHLAGGGKMAGLIRVPRPVREAEELIRFVKVGGSPIDTVAEAERARDHLRFRTQVQLIESWATSHGLQRPARTPHHDWLTALVGVPTASEQVQAACKRAEELVQFPFGTAPDEPTAFLSATLATVSSEVAEALRALADVAKTAPRVQLSGLPIRSRHDAARASAAIQAAAERRSCHAMLPESWQDRCNPVDTDEGDLLADMLAVAAAAAEVPGPARTASLAPTAVNGIAERAQRDRRRAELLDEHDRVVGSLRRTLVACVPQSPATQSIAAAVGAEDPIGYRVGVDALEYEIEMSEQAHRYANARIAAHDTHPELLTALDLEDAGAIQILESIRAYEAVRDHERTVRSWIETVGSADEVHAELRRLHHEALKSEARLANFRCWDKAVERLQARRELRSALSALSNAMDAVPKTRTAKSYPARMRALRNATADAAPAIPCWVMTIDRVAEVLGYPTGEDRFDVVIIDEASQAWFPAMFLYAIADQVIVVGDKLQTSPSTTVMSVEQLAAIAREHIFGHRLEDRIGDDLSLYDVAEVMTGPDMMADHFRCVPEIIDISNRLSYAPMGRSLQPSRVREPGAVQPVVHVHVDGHRSGTAAANDAEVKAIVAQVVRCHADPSYDGMTFGVVVVGPSPAAQLKLLRTRLLDELGAQAMRERELEVGTASQFQGAERHVMFLSLVVAPEEGERIRIWPHEHTGRNRRNVQQLNVAVSRARDQLWIFHSFEPGQLAPGDARAVLFEAKPLEPLGLDELLDSCHSKFERDVVTAIATADETLVFSTQVEALGYAIDIVVEDRHGHRLAVECDGDRWHSSDSQIRADLYRQRTLENIGWRFHRFLASEWYDDPDRHVRAILAELVRCKAPKPARTTTVDTAGVSTGRSDLSLVDGERPSSEDDVTDLRWEDEELDDDDDDDLDADELAPRAEDRPEEEDDDDRTGGSLQRASHPPRVPATITSGDKIDGTHSTGQASLELWTPGEEPVEALTCGCCGQEWTRKIVRGRKPTRCASCTSVAPKTKMTLSATSSKERNRRLAAAMRDLGKEPNGPAWSRAKELLEAGCTYDAAAREA